MLLSFVFVALAASPSFVETDAVDEGRAGTVVFAPGEKYAWCERCPLEMRVFMRTSLANELHVLAPTLEADALAAQGNYQFTFFVDGAKVYTEKLSRGAGSPSSKKRLTTFRVPLISTTDEDSWGRFLWLRFIYRGGGEEALSEGSHRLRLEIRPYVLAAVGEIIATGELTVTVARPVIAEKQVAVQKIAPQTDFEVSKAPLAQYPIRELNRQIAQRVFKDITSLVVLRDGQLVLEEYFNGAKRETLHDTRSVGKSFASALTGLALRDGHLKSVEQPLSAFYDVNHFANASPEKAAVTIKELLTMSSGFEGDDDDSDSPGNEENMYPTRDWSKFVLDLPMRSEAKHGWVYFTAGVVLLGDILDKSVPGGLEKYAERTLFKPLGIRSYEWARTPKKTVSTAGGLKLRALDLAKFGQLYQNRGRWHDAVILPEAWVEASLRKQVTRPDGAGYGYLFWNTPYSVEGVAYNAMNASGNGGNKVFVFTDQHLVVVVTSTAYNQPYAHGQVDKLMQRLVLPALSGAPK